MQLMSMEASEELQKAAKTTAAQTGTMMGGGGNKYEEMNT
jgi:hypothetical protein